MNLNCARRAFLTLFIVSSASVLAGSPDCTYFDAWPSSMAFVELKNAGLADNESLDFSKTTIVRLASEKIGKHLYRQVHRVRFVKKTGEQIEVITANDASHQECSMSDVDVYVVSQRLPKNTGK